MLLITMDKLLCTMHQAQEMLRWATLLLDRGADVNAADNAGETPLHCASREDEVDAVTLLLDRGADVNVADNNGQTPLHYASSSGAVEAVRLLLDRGAGVNVADNNGQTPLHHASRNMRRFDVLCIKLR